MVLMSARPLVLGEKEKDQVLGFGLCFKERERSLQSQRGRGCKSWMGREGRIGFGNNRVKHGASASYFTSIKNHLETYKKKYINLYILLQQLYSVKFN
jgi:hypothetical protein